MDHKVGYYRYRYPTRKSTLTGHNTEVSYVAVLAELGMVVSGSQGRLL